MPYYPQPVTVKDTGTPVGTQPAINFIEGTNVSITLTNDPANQEVDVEIAASGGGASDFQPSIVTGNYYYPPNVFFTEWEAEPDVLIAFPIWFSHTETWTRVGIKCSVGESSKNLRVGLYANGANNEPGALIADFGAIDLTSTGDLELTISQSLAANTLYWIACVSDATAATVYCTGITIPNPYFNTIGWVGGLTSAFDINGAAGRSLLGRTFTYAALPDPFGTPDVFGTYGPAIWLRKV